MSLNDTEPESFDRGRREMSQDQRCSATGEAGLDVGDMQKERVNK